MSYNSKYTGQQVEELLDQVASGGTGGEGGTITEAEILAMGFTKNEGTITEVKMNGVSKGTSGVVDLGDVVTEDVLDGYVTTDTDQTIDGVKTFTNYVNVKRNPENDSVMHMGQNADGQGMIYIESTTSQPMMFYNNTPNGRIQIRSLKADSMPNIELLDGQVAMTISTEDSYTGIFTSNKKGASTGLAMGTNKKGSFQIVYPETTDDMPEIASITHHGDIMLRALKSEYANENYAWLRYDPNINTLNISAFEATTEGGYPMDLDVQINGKEVAKKEDMPTKVSELENDAKYASAEDTDDVVEEPEGGGSAGGSNIYTLDIGEWDGVSNIDSIPITKEALIDMLAADSVRIKFYDPMGIGDTFFYPTHDAKFENPEYDIYMYVFVSHSAYGDIALSCFIYGDDVECSIEVVESAIPYQPVFVLGKQDIDGNWTTVSVDISPGLADINKKSLSRICEYGYGIYEGLMNAPLLFEFLPLACYTPQSTLFQTDYVDGTEIITGVGFFVERFSLMAGGKEFFEVSIDNDGNVSIEKIE